MKDFATAWNAQRQLGDIKARSTVPNHTKRQHTSSTYRHTPTPTTPSQVWPELAGNSQHKSYTYSPILAKAQHDHAQSVFQRMDYVLSKFVEKW